MEDSERGKREGLGQSQHKQQEGRGREGGREGGRERERERERSIIIDLEHN